MIKPPSFQNPLSTAAVQQPTQSETFPFDAAQAQMAASMGMGMPMYSPAAMSIPTALTDPATQQNINKTSNYLLEKMRGPSPAQKGAETGTDIFSKIIAPAIGFFGGNGSAAGAVQFINQARQDVKDARTQRLQEEQMNAQALKAVVDVANTTGLKPWSEWMKAQTKANDQALQREKLAETRTYHDSLVDRWKATDTRIREIAGNRDKLKSRGLDIDERKLEQIRDHGNKSIELKRQLAILSAQMQQRGQDMRNNQFAQQLGQRLKFHQDEESRLTNEHNTEMQMKLGEMQKDTKTGKLLPKYADESGKMLDPAEFMINAPTEGAIEPTEQDYFNVDQFVQSMPAPAPTPAATTTAAPTGSQPSAAPAVGGQIKPQFQSITKQYGMKPDEAKRLFIDAAMRKGGMTFDQAVEAAKGL